MFNRPIRAEDSLEDMSRRVAYASERAKLTKLLSRDAYLRVALCDDLGRVTRVPDASDVAEELFSRFSIAPDPAHATRAVFDVNVRALWAHVDRVVQESRRADLHRKMEELTASDRKLGPPPLAVIAAMHATDTVAELTQRTAKELDGTVIGDSTRALGTAWRSVGSPTTTGLPQSADVAAPFPASAALGIDDAEHASLRQRFVQFMQARHSAAMEAALAEKARHRRLLESEGRADALAAIDAADAANSTRAEPWNRRHVKLPGQRFGALIPPPTPPPPTDEEKVAALIRSRPEYTDEELAVEKLKLVKFYSHVAPHKSEAEIDEVLRHYGPPEGFAVMWRDLYERYCFAPLRREQEQLSSGTVADVAMGATSDEAPPESSAVDDTEMIATSAVASSAPRASASPRSVTFAVEDDGGALDAATTVTGSFGRTSRKPQTHVDGLDESERFSSSRSTSHRTTSAVCADSAVEDAENAAERAKWRRRFVTFYAMVVPSQQRKNESEIERLMDRYRDEMRDEADGAPYELMMRHLVRKYGNGATGVAGLSVTQIMSPPRELSDAIVSRDNGDSNDVVPLHRVLSMQYAMDPKRQLGQGAARSASGILEAVRIAEAERVKQQRDAMGQPLPGVSGGVASGVMTIKLAFTLSGFDFTVYHFLPANAQAVVRRAFEVDLVANLSEAMQRVVDDQMRLIAYEKRVLKSRGATDEMLEKSTRTSASQYPSSVSLWKRLSAAIQREKRLRALRRLALELPKCGAAKVTRVVGGTLVNADLVVPRVRSAVANVSEALITKIENGEFTLPTLRQTHQDAMGILAPRLAVSAVAIFGGVASADFHAFYEQAVTRDPRCGALTLVPEARGAASVIFDVLDTKSRKDGLEVAEFLRSVAEEERERQRQAQEEALRRESDLQMLSRKTSMLDVSHQLREQSLRRINSPTRFSPRLRSVSPEGERSSPPPPLRRTGSICFDENGMRREVEKPRRRFIDDIWGDAPEVEAAGSLLAADYGWAKAMMRDELRGKPLLSPPTHSSASIVEAASTAARPLSSFNRTVPEGENGLERLVDSIKVLELGGGAGRDWVTMKNVGSSAARD